MLRCHRNINASFLENQCVKPTNAQRGGSTVAKRDPYIEQEKRWRRVIRETVAKCYAAFALASYDMGLVPKRNKEKMFEVYVELFSKTQEYFNDNVRDGIDIIERCAEVTGIDMMSEMTARERGIEKGTRV